MKKYKSFFKIILHIFILFTFFFKLVYAKDFDKFNKGDKISSYFYLGSTQLNIIKPMIEKQYA